MSRQPSQNRPLLWRPLPGTEDLPVSRAARTFWIVAWAIAAVMVLAWLYLALGFAGPDGVWAARSEFGIVVVAVVGTILLAYIAWRLRATTALSVLGGLLVVGLFCAFMGPLGIAGALLLVVAIALIVRTIRTRRAITVLAYVEQAVRQNLPLNHSLAAAAASETGLTAFRLRMICDALERGSPIHAALEQHLPELPARIVQLIAAGARLGSLPQTLQMVLRRERINRAGRYSPAAYGFLYALVLLLTIAGVLALFCVFILPKFKQIFKDFRIELPAITRRIAMLADSASYVLFALVGIVGLIALIYIGRKLWEIFWPADVARGRPGLAAWVIWHTPLARDVARNKGLADVCRVSGEAIRAGFTLDRALGEATTLAINPGLLVQVRDWRRGIENGAAVSDAARDAGLPPLLAGMLGSAQAAGGMADTFDFLGRYYETRFSRTILLLQGAVAPLTSLVFGAIVCAIALSMFLPMIRLIEGAGGTWHRF